MAPVEEEGQNNFFLNPVNHAKETKASTNDDVFPEYAPTAKPGISKTKIDDLVGA